MGGGHMRNMEHLQAGRRERIGVYKQRFCGAGAVRGNQVVRGGGGAED